MYEQHSSGLNQWSKVCLRICFKELLERQSKLLRWVAFDPEFKLTGIDGRFKHWYRRGITSYCSISSKGELDSFQKILDTYGLEKFDFFRYLQIRSYFNDEIKPTEECETNLIDIFIDMYKNMDNKKTCFKTVLPYSI